MEVKLSSAVVKIKESLSWGDTQKIQSALMSGAKIKSDETKKVGFDFSASGMIDAKYVALECAVLEIIEKGKTSIFSRDWMDNLSIEDGEKLYAAVDSLSKKNEEISTN